MITLETDAYKMMADRSVVIELRVHIPLDAVQVGPAFHVDNLIAFLQSPGHNTTAKLYAVGDLVQRLNDPRGPSGPPEQAALGEAPRRALDLGIVNDLPTR